MSCRSAFESDVCKMETSGTIRHGRASRNEWTYVWTSELIKEPRLDARTGGCTNTRVRASVHSRGCIPHVILTHNAAEISLIKRTRALDIHSKKKKTRLWRRGLPCAISLRRVSPVNEAVSSTTKLRQCNVLDLSRVTLTWCLSSLLKHRSWVDKDSPRSRFRWSPCGRGEEMFGFTSRRGDYPSQNFDSIFILQITWMIRGENLEI